MDDITVAVEDRVDVDAYLTVMAGSGLADRRPYGDDGRVGALLARSAPVVGARTAEGELIGVARSISDGGFMTFLCDLAVVEAYQGQGIARELVEVTRDACERTLLVVTAAPDVDAFYDHLGLRRHHSTWYGLPTDLTGFPSPPATS
ncbi:GNAT family N-acetyltransferase [Euzebya sp.]|uniref:GNAT family N-acetyltransferase n=1 Tax=Euzebya sp. TaxID=1971409 RepID=UPI003518E9C5